MKPFPAEQDLTFQSLKGQQRDHPRQHSALGLATADGYTYAQLQEIRTYYPGFLDVDVDRYHLSEIPISR